MPDFSSLTLQKQVNDSTPLPNIHVDAYASTSDAENGIQARGTMTGNDGNYDLSLPIGTYILLINQQGGGNPEYAQEYYNNQPTPDSADPVTVAASVTTSNIDVHLPKAGHIRCILLPQL